MLSECSRCKLCAATYRIINVLIEVLDAPLLMQCYMELALTPKPYYDCLCATSEMQSKRISDYRIYGYLAAQFWERSVLLAWPQPLRVIHCNVLYRLAILAWTHHG